MAALEVRTRTRITTRHGPELVVEVHFVPRGSGNRKKAHELARQARKNEQLAPHLRRVIAGTSKVSMIFRPSLELMRIIATWPPPPRDAEGQMPLFSGVALPV